MGTNALVAQAQREHGLPIPTAGCRAFSPKQLFIDIDDVTTLYRLDPRNEHIDGLRGFIPPFFQGGAGIINERIRASSRIDIDLIDALMERFASRRPTDRTLEGHKLESPDIRIKDKGKLAIVRRARQRN